MTGLDQKTAEREWILLDGAVLDAPRLVYEHDDQPELDYLYRNTPHEGAMEASPCLVKPSPSSRLWSEQARWREHGIILVTDENLYPLADHLRSLLSIRLPDGAFAYLRFYSPKQLPRLMAAFSDLERDEFSGPITDWLAFRNDAQWRRFSAAGKRPARQASEEGWFVFADHHIDVLANRAKDEFVTKLARYLSLNDSCRLNALVQQASSFGFRTEKDVSRYAELAVVHGERIKHPELQAILSSSEMPAGMRLSEVDRRLAYGVAS